MSAHAIVAEGLGKRYPITQSGREAYSTLRDTLANGFKRRARTGSGAAGKAKDSVVDFWALRDVSFEVAQGDVVGIIGRNGAGKSTLLKLLSRITEPTTGHIRIRGCVASLLEVGTGFHPELTGRENIFLNGAILGMSRREIIARFDEIVDFAEVEQFLDTPVKRYSSGMYVRLAFAVAASLEPDILIVDEVLAVGDAEFQRKCLGKMRDVSHDAGRTVLFVSHAMGSIRSLCGEVIWLEKGVIRKSGAPSDVINAYLETSAATGESGVILSGLKRIWPGHGEKLMIDRVLVNGGRRVVHTEPATISVEYGLRGSVGDLGFEIGLTSMEGVRVMTVDSNLDGRQMDFAEGHRGVVSVTIPALHLQPGKYAIDVSVRSGEQVGLDHLPACVWMTVLPGPNTPPVVFRETHGVRQPAEWKWELR